MAGADKLVPASGDDNEMAWSYKIEPKCLTHFRRTHCLSLSLSLVIFNIGPGPGLGRQSGSPGLAWGCRCGPRPQGVSQRHVHLHTGGHRESSSKAATRYSHVAPRVAPRQAG